MLHPVKKTNLLLVVLLITALSLSAQQRYFNEIFSTVQVTADVKYGENYSLITGSPILEDLLMDVYEPVGDTLSQRPLIILTHGGSFLPKDFALPCGYKNDSALIEMCTQFAKRGWVAVSMAHRIGWNPLSTDETTRKGTYVNAVYRAQQDMRACVRYFRKDAATSDTYKINPYRIAVGGTNTGGNVALATSSLNDFSELTLFKFRNPGTGNSVVDTSLTGGIYGQGGMAGVNAPMNNPGYSSAVQVVLNLGGAILDTAWQQSGEPPIVSLHGIQDPITPFSTTILIVGGTGQPVIEVSGSHDLARRAVNLGNHQIFYDLNLSDPYTQMAESRSSFEGLLGFPGSANGFEPWAWYDSSLARIARPDISNPTYTGYGSAANPFASRAKAENYIDTIMNYFTPRVIEAFNHVDSAKVQSPDPGGSVITSLFTAGDQSPLITLTVQPNPFSNTAQLTFELAKKELVSIAIFDFSGKEVWSLKNDFGAGKHRIEWAGNDANGNPLSNGLYHVRMMAGEHVMSGKVIMMK